MTFEGISSELDTQHAEGAAAALRTTTAIRKRASHLLERARVGASRWFTVDDAALQTAAGQVADLTRERYPSLVIPFHSRWRHFEAGGVDRKAELDKRLAGLAAPAKARALIDLALVSVLLDAGAGPDWQYHESASGQVFTRSEGLAVASFHAFTAGLFSSDPAHPLQVDAAALRGLVADRLAAAFQVSSVNPLVGIDGRVVLLRRLGETLAAQPEVFGPQGRPGGLFDMLVSPLGPSTIAPTATISAHDILSQLLMSLSPIWPAQNAIGTVPLGDCWRHDAVPGAGLTAGWMPFHKLSQWLTYSLLEPFQWAGVHVDGVDALTGLPEYRNGGLLLDAGVLVLTEPSNANRVWHPGDELIVEWRALTVALLDALAPLVRARLGGAAAQMPLACVLEGGTWATGRLLAQRLRGGSPPFAIHSDGTVF
ncbi:URC4/urg3 family protein [Pseudorhodoferax sp. Leaf267]|uniref:URC4/urg3 family protein n=1 Tax=Pseudorhodoferax sp. Leaf267 TaxID=1736316 RepID=UPI0006FEDBB9|nr:URC4/urg3 family protein [Pseudorhodoferax sp. Leaf267]KQP22925.1 uracil phosphoribosyltransferase [Pseudorhodoferax sp. Leaf267]